jgi:starch synthase
MKILFVSSEAAPLAKVGGLADVVGSLPKALTALGHEVRVLIPQYGSLDTNRFPLTPVITGYPVSLPGDTQSVNLNLTVSDGAPVYTLENPKYFGTREIYGTFDLERFFFFSRAAFEILPKIEWSSPGGMIVHCHDWLTSLVVMWIKKTGSPYSTVFTIHNLAYQGYFDELFMYRHDLKKDWDYFPPDAPHPPLSFMGQAVLWADLVTAVSETYAREITTPEYGMGLDALLRYRAAGGGMTGIVNGIDYRDWDPKTDIHLPVNFDSSSMKNRALNKIALQKVAGLPVDSSIPLIGMVQRLDEQKGIDILGQGADRMLQETGAQLIILGRGRENYEEMLRQIDARYPRQVSVFIAFEEALAHLIYAGCDMFLMPSHFEPCGLGQMIAMRYGALPIVRHTGGLVDTVPAFSPDLRQGNGFVFHEYSPEALIEVIKEASEAFQNKKAWLQAMQRVSRLDFSWQSSARRYETAYQQVLERTRMAEK